jgi:hypothetical protein
VSKRAPADSALITDKIAWRLSDSLIVSHSLPRAKDIAVRDGFGETFHHKYEESE